LILLVIYNIDWLLSTNENEEKNGGLSGLILFICLIISTVSTTTLYLITGMKDPGYVITQVFSAGQNDSENSVMPTHEEIVSTSSNIKKRPAS